MKPSFRATFAFLLLTTVILGCDDDECRTHDSLIANNPIHDLTGPTVNQGDGIEIKAGSYANIVRANVTHDTAYPGITLYHTNGNGAPNIVERNVIWNNGDNGIQVTPDAIIRNSIVPSAAAHGMARFPHRLVSSATRSSSTAACSRPTVMRSISTASTAAC